MIGLYASGVLCFGRSNGGRVKWTPLFYLSWHFSPYFLCLLFWASYGGW